MTASIALALQHRWHQLQASHNAALDAGDSDRAKQIYAEMVGINIEIAMLARGQERPVCRWCKTTTCTSETSPQCYCLDCEAPLVPCRCRHDCQGGNCYECSKEGAQ